MIDALRHQALRNPDGEAYLFLEDGEHEGQRLTFSSLERRARALGQYLSQQVPIGSRVLLLLPSGLEFIEAFLGCLYAGMVAVPAYPPEPARVNRMLPRLRAIIQDAHSSLVLTTRELLAAMEHVQVPELRSVHWLALDELDLEVAGDWTPPALDKKGLAFLQYTSGSTATPKGVRVSHANLSSTLADSDVGLDHTPQSVMVTWLPAFHDLGLIYGLLLPLWVGFRCVMLPPASFLQRPLRWLEALSRYRGTHSAAPNFAYGLCVEKSTPEQRRRLDLSSWRVTLNAAEPIRRATEQRFMEAFAPCGFRPETFCHAYGLAEFTVKVSSQAACRLPSFCCVDDGELKAHRIREVEEGHPGARWIASCGSPALDTRIEIVHPETRERCRPGEVGEIWVTGSSLAGGYWQQPEESAATFGATLASTGEGPFLRTGDLGFLKEGELFVTGRQKDLLVVRGRNHYPQDLEQTAEECHPMLRSGCSAAFAVEEDGEEHLVLVAEVKSPMPQPGELEEVLEAIHRAVAAQHEVHVHTVVLIDARTLPKTSSGKIQRRACRSVFLDGGLREAARRVFARRPWSESGSGGRAQFPEATRDESAIASWIAARLSQWMDIPLHEVDTQRALLDYGMDSEQALELTADLGSWLGRKVPATAVYVHPTIHALAVHLAGAHEKP
ncbi:MAG TPA: AMP-binding protein [Archangium sp.]|uniref:AMP-binding protein n=1 Tax=Archangium sp. TaxID=1872627 RepID=UPI002E378CEF|nr:AMP-binding protein [Archangium sp.]HEX5752088.1 AMP-binding protein [Archangium sp.]